MKKLLVLSLAVVGLILGGCASSEPPADTSGVVDQSEAPPMSGSAEAGGSGASSGASAAPDTGP
ncbi:MAG: hypothetical protein LCH41_10090 [Armatimonadetes bacterium]|nr:hypothetical protein [Armatimonadota bacterium]